MSDIRLKSFIINNKKYLSKFPKWKRDVVIEIVKEYYKNTEGAK